MVEIREMSRPQVWAIIAGLALAVLATQWPAFRAEALKADYQIFQNPLVVGVGMGSYPLAPFLAQRGATGLAYYRPLTTWSYRLNYAFSGEGPAGYRVLNAALHFLVALLLFQLFQMLTRDVWLSAATGLLFAAHPVAGSVVATLGGREELLYTFFLVLAWKLHVRAQDQRVPGKFPVKLLWALVAYLAALLSNEKAPIFLGLILLGDLTFRFDRTAKSLWQSLVGVIRKNFYPFYFANLAVTGLYFVWKYGVIGVRPWSVAARIETVDNPILYQSFAMSLLNAVKLSGLYLGKAIWQVPPMGDSYDFVPVTSLVDLWLLVSIGIWLLVLILARQLNRQAIIAFAPAWIFVLGILPALNIFYRTPDVLADQHVYLPAVAMAFGLALVGRHLRSGKVRPALVSGLGAAILLLFCSIGVRNSTRISTEIGWMQSLHAWAPYNVKLTTKLSQSIWAASRGPEALTLLEELSKARPESALAISEWARGQATARNFDEASKILGQAKRITPAIAEPYLIQGNVYESTGKEAAAITEYKTALQIQPRLVRAMSLLGVLHLRLKQYDTAFQYYQQALAVNPGSAGNCVNLGTALTQQNRKQEALPYYELGMKLDPTLPEVYLNLSSAYAASGHRNRAVEFYETTHRLFGQNREVVIRLGMAYVQMGSYDKAVTLFKDAMAQNPKDTGLMLYLGDTYREAGEFSLALEQYKKLMELNAKDPDPYLGVAYMYSAMGKYPEALGMLQKAVKLAPNHPMPYLQMGNVHLATKQYEAAIEAYAQALKLAPTHAQARYNLAKAYEVVGKISEAIQNYEEFLKLWQGDPNLAQATRTHIAELRLKALKP